MNRPFIICLLFGSCLLSSCSTQDSTDEASHLKTFAMGRATVQLPATWRLLDTTQAHISAHKGREYILQNTRSRHADSRETLSVDFINVKGEGSVAKMGPAYADYLKETFDDVQISSVKDTSINNRVIQVMECAFTLKEPKTKLISTIAFTEHHKQLVTIVGTAVRSPEMENLKNQSVFRQAIFSFRWK